MDILVGGVLAGVVAAFIWTLIVAGYRVRRLKREFAPLSGTYRVTRKFTDQPQPETLSITVKKNLLTVQSQGADGLYSGLIAMSEEFPSSGRGHYQHAKDGAQLWGFWDVQRKDDDTLLVHTTFTKPTQVAVVAGYEWERIEH